MPPKSPPPLDGPPPAGVVLDLDGTLTDNMPLHGEAFDRFARRHGLPALTPELRRRLDGKRNRDIFPVLFGRPLSEDELRAFGAEKEGLYRELSRGRLEPLPGLHAFLDALAAAGVPVAVATSAPAENVPHTLGGLGLADRLRTVVRADEVPRGKPFPDVFLAAAGRLGVAPTACLAVEDSPMGLRAARAAGMRTVGLTTTFPAAELASLADLVAADYLDLLDRLPLPTGGGR